MQNFVSFVEQFAQIFNVILFIYYHIKMLIYFFLILINIKKITKASKLLNNLMKS